MEVSMKVHLIRIAVIALAIVSPLPATPVAARPKDPDSFQVTPPQPGGCNFGTSFGDPPLNRLCPAGSDEPATTQSVSQRPAEAQRLLRTAVRAVTRAGSLQYTPAMWTTMTNDSGSWTVKSTSVGDYIVPDALRGVLTIANPWSETQSAVVVADGEAYVSHPQTGAWEKILQLATSYHLTTATIVAFL
jgi:hypothetical protein